MSFTQLKAKTNICTTFSGAIGIDATHMVRDITYHPIVDVLPLEFLERSKAIIDWCLSAQAQKVMVIFDGLIDEEPKDPYVTKGIAPENEDTNPSRLEILIPPPKSEIQSSETMNALFMALILHYRENSNVLIMRAPYFAWSQLAALYRDKQIVDVFGPLELFIFPHFKRVLYRFAADSMGYVDDVSVGDEVSLHAAAVVRKESQHPYIQKPLLNQAIFVSPVFVMSSNVGIDLVRLDVSDGHANPINREMGKDLNMLFGHNIWGPNRALIVHMAYGLLPVSVVRAIVIGERLGRFDNDNLYLPIVPTFAFLPEHTPYFPRFNTALSFMHPLLVQIVYQVIDKFRFSPETGHRPPVIKLDEWILTGWQREHLPFWVVYLDLLGLRARPQSTYQDAVAVHFAVRLKVLDLMGYFTHAMTNECDDSGLSAFAWALRLCKPEHACAGVLFIEACRTQMLDGESLLVDTKNSSTECKNREAMLGARIMSLIKLRRAETTQTEKAYQRQPWNMNVIAFSNLARLSFSVLQKLNLVMAFNTLSNSGIPENVPVAEVYENLIFNEAPTPYLGFVAYKIFSTPSDRQLTMDDLHTIFPDATHLVEDLREAAAFLKVVDEMVDKIKGDDSGISQDQADQIKKSYAYCSEKLRAFPDLADVFSDAGYQPQ